METIIARLDVVWKIIFILFFFGFCIFIHEFGHMLAALWQGLVVERFSIGLGKPIFTLFKWRGIDFVVSWVPFGGYVSLPQLDATEAPKTEEEGGLEPCKPIPRAIVAFAGPFFNILFGFVLAAIMWWAGLYEAPPASSCVIAEIPRSIPQYSDKVKITDRIKAIGGQETDKFLEEACRDLAPGTELEVTVERGGKSHEATVMAIANPEWEAGLRKGDRIVAVNGKGFKKGLEEFSTEYVYSGGYRVRLSFIRDGRQMGAEYTPLPNPLFENLGSPFFSARNPVAVGGVAKGSPADEAGLMAGDQLLQIDDVNIIDGRQFMDCVAGYGGAPFSLLVERKGRELLLPSVSCPEPSSLQALGIHFSVIVSGVIKGMPAFKAGLRKGDRIIEVDGGEVLDSKLLTEYIRGTRGRPMDITLLRGGRRIELKGVASEKRVVDGGEAYLIGVTLSDSTPKVIGHPSPWRQFDKVVRQTWRTLGLLFSPITSKVTGRELGRATVKVEHMSGAVGILAMMWYTLESEGLRGGFAIIILITFSLALMNLLPIPALDGCYILFSVIEIAIGRRLPAKLVNILVSAFFYLLLFLIVYITFFDGRRIFRLIKFGSSKGVPQRVEMETAAPAEPPAVDAGAEKEAGE